MIKRRPRARNLTIFFATMSLLLGSPALAGAAGDKETPRQPVPMSDAERVLLATEAAGQQLNVLVERNKALASYYDAATKGFVVVVPSSGPGSTLGTADFVVPGFTTTVRRSALSQDIIDTINKKIELRAAKQYSYGSYFDAKNDRMVVESDAPWDVVKTLLGDQAGLVEYRYGVAERNTRRNDPPPHWGGASIRNAAGASCTSGFSVKNGAGTRFMVTAGHCFAAGAAVTSPEGGHAWGTVVNRAPFPTWDLELIGGNSYGTSIYVGDTTGTGSSILGAADPVLNFSGYCVSGQSGSKCGKTVNSLNAQFCDVSGCTPGLASYTGGALTLGGDSGAPLYLPGSGGEHIRGVHIALSGTTMYAERWNTVAARFGVSIVP